MYIVKKLKYFFVFYEDALNNEQCSSNTRLALNAMATGTTGRKNTTSPIIKFAGSHSAPSWRQGLCYRSSTSTTTAPWKNSASSLTLPNATSSSTTSSSTTSKNTMSPVSSAGRWSVASTKNRPIRTTETKPCAMNAGCNITNELNKHFT